MSTTDYTNKDVWRKICSTTLSNYINMEKRLSDNKRISNLILTYYSVFLIINSLTALFFEWYNKQLCEYFGLILSIVLLAYSLINSNANYSQRIDLVTKAINELKTLKRTLTDDNIEEFKKKYYNITDNIEFRSDIDFFYTVKSLCKEHNVNCFKKPSTINGEGLEIEKIKNYLSELSPIMLQMKIIFRICLNVFLLTLPIVVTLVCIFF